MTPHYIEVSADVRYWDDAFVNGTSDDDGKLIPCKKDNSWCPVIRLSDGYIQDWDLGVVADVHYKVCDAGEYWLLDENKQRIAKWEGYYVPNEFLCQGDNGYGDYIIMKIDAEGYVIDWRQPAIEFVCDCEEDSQYGWKKIEQDENQ